MLAAETFLRNAVVLLASARTCIDAFRAPAPGRLPAVEAALAGDWRAHDALRLATEPWCGAADISIEDAVMEWAKKFGVVPFGAGWADLGGWDAVWREGEQDGDGVVCTGTVTAIGCVDTLLRCDVEAVGLGLKDVMVVAMGDAIRAADRTRAQEV